VICRTWSGWTNAANADAYEQLLLDRIVPGIVSRGIPGFREIQVLREPASGGEVRFTTLMWFDSLEAIRAFAGDDYAAAVVSPDARALLLRFDERSTHAEVRARLGDAGAESQGPTLVRPPSS
jgi:heme-degrading monooxygenase HmoA